MKKAKKKENSREPEPAEAWTTQETQAWVEWESTKSSPKKTASDAINNIINLMDVS